LHVEKVEKPLKHFEVPLSLVGLDGQYLVRACVLQRVWLASNSAECDWVTREKLAQLSTSVAPQFLVFPCFRDAKEMVQLFVDGWQLDYRSPTVRGMLDVCAGYLS